MTEELGNVSATFAAATGDFASQGEATEEAPAIEHPELVAYVSQLQNELDAKYEAIRTDPELDQGSKHREIVALAAKGNEAYGNLLKYYESELQERADGAERHLFYVTPSQRDAVRQAYNHAYDATQLGFESGDVEGIQFAREELERLWVRAERTNDRELMHALGQLSIERGYDDLRARYLQTSDEKQKAWEKYAAARTQLAHFQDPGERMWMNLTSSTALVRPPEARE